MYASAELKDAFGVILHAVAETAEALQDASPAQRAGGFENHLRHLCVKAYNVEKPTFIATVLFGARAPSPRGSNDEVEERRQEQQQNVFGAAADAAAASSLSPLSILRPSARLPRSMSLNVKRLIWEYAGVRSGAKWTAIEAAVTSLENRMTWELTFDGARPLGMHLASNRQVDSIEPNGQAAARFVKKGSFVCAVEGVGAKNLQGIQRAFKECKRKKCKFIKLTFSKSELVEEVEEEIDDVVICPGYGDGDYDDGDY